MSLLITTVFLCLLLSWFRYTCVAVLRTPARKYEQQITSANQLNLPKVRDQLRGPARQAHLDQLREMLQSDYRLITYLSRYGARYRMESYEFDVWLLHVDYHVMKLLYAVAHKFSCFGAQFALAEMAQVIGQLANGMGRRAEQRAY